MARPSKSTDVLKADGKSHRTKAEMAQREAAEKALLTGITMRENADVKKDKVAHREYQRVIKILTAIGKNDALFESVINDYCRLESDIQRYRELRNELENDDTISGSTRYELIAKYDMQIEKYRKQRRDIEKENGMTIASSARSIPKTPTKAVNPLMEVLGIGTDTG